MMKIIQAFFFTLLITFTLAPAVQANDQIANINTGNFLAGGSLSFSKNWYAETSNSSIYLYAPIQYFVWDRLALGGAFQASTYFQPDLPTQTTIGAGPAATYYFLLQDRTGYYASQRFFYNHFSAGDYSSHNLNSSSSIGMSYFFTPSVAFGPALEFTHYFKAHRVFEWVLFRVSGALAACT